MNLLKESVLGVPETMNPIGGWELAMLDESAGQDFDSTQKC